MKQFGPKISFQLRNLSADCWLLNAVRHLARSRSHAAVTHYMIEQLQVMNVNSSIITYLDVVANDYRLTQ